jgi:GT2 family glycosyltransferase
LPLPPATLIVLAWNRWELTRKCLATLRETELQDAEVLVVDNGSTDETPAELAKMDWIRVLTLPSNLGFTQRDWLRHLRSAAHSSPDIGIAGCRLVLPDGRLLHAGTYILPDTLWGQQIGSLEKDVGQYPGVRDVEGIVFACAYLRRQTLEKIGGLSLDFESYFEDTDYCLRAREAGLRTVVAGDVTLVHDEHGSTKDATASRRAIFERSREAFGRKWKARLESRYRKDLLWQSILNFPTGYAMSSRELVRALDQEDVRVSYRYVYGRGTVFPRDEPESSGDYRLDVIARRASPRRPPVSVVYGQGDVFSRNQGRYKIGYTMLEVDGFPRDWVRQGNKMDEVWVPSEFNRQGFLRSGLKRPVHVIPLGVETDTFNPGVTAWPNPSGEFVFLTSFEWGERKEPWLLLKAFSETFSSREPVRLVCKVMNRDGALSLKEEISRLGLSPAGGKISWLFNLEFPHYQLASLYRSADAYISVSRGEGWDMPLMEAMACGLPAIATDWGAHTEFLHAGIAYPLAIKGTIPAIAKCPYYDGYSWADPDGDHLRALLREVYVNREEARGRGKAAAAEMAARWSWRSAARKIVGRLEAAGLR